MIEKLIKSRRRWTEAEKIRVVKLTRLPGATVSGVARQADIAVSQLFAWKRVYKDHDLNSAQEQNSDELTIRLLQAELKILRLERNFSLINFELQKLSELDSHRPYFVNKSGFSEW
jgi:transposase-like protein